MASSPRSRVQDDGSFVLEGLSPGLYGLMLRYHGTSRYVHVEVAGEDIDGIVIPQREGRGVIRATVRGLEFGGVDIVPVSDLPKPRQPATRLMDFEDGGFEVEGLAEGRYRVLVFDHEDSGRSRERVVDLTGRHEAEIVFELDG